MHRAMVEAAAERAVAPYTDAMERLLERWLPETHDGAQEESQRKRRGTPEAHNVSY